jgi:hypothetical protein
MENLFRVSCILPQFCPPFSPRGTLLCYGLPDEAEGGVAVDVTVRRE